MKETVLSDISNEASLTNISTEENTTMPYIYGIHFSTRSI